MNRLIEWLPSLWEATLTTLWVASVAAVLATALGALILVLLLVDFKPLTVVLRVFISIFRNTPLLVQIFFIFYGLPLLGINLGPATSGILAITLNEGAFIAEILRGSSRGISKGEIDAANSLGLSKWKRISLVYFPLSFRAGIPAVTGQWSIVLKDTSLLSFVMIFELSRAGNQFYANYFDNTAIWIVAVIYVLLFGLFTLVGKTLERRLKVRR